MRGECEQRQPKTQEITTTAQRISKPHDAAKNYYLRSITQETFSPNRRNKQAISDINIAVENSHLACYQL